MKVHFTDDAWADYLHWVENDRDMLARVNALIEDARHHLFTGLGKPEPLKGRLAGWWSRRISRDHRLVYRIEGKPGEEQSIELAACCFHYE